MLRVTCAKKDDSVMKQGELSFSVRDDWPSAIVKHNIWLYLFYRKNMFEQ